MVFNDKNELQTSIQVMLRKKDLVYDQKFKEEDGRLKYFTWHVHVQERKYCEKIPLSILSKKLIVKQR